MVIYILQPYHTKHFASKTFSIWITKNLGKSEFSGIGIAVIGRNHPIGGIFAALLFAGMLNGAKFMEYDWGISSELVIAIQGAIIIALAIPALLAVSRRGVRRLKIRRRPR